MAILILLGLLLFLPILFAAVASLCGLLEEPR
jgi:hypothetical protein